MLIATWNVNSILVRMPNVVRWLDQSKIGRILTGDAEALKGGPPVKAMLIQNTNPVTVAPEQNLVRRGFAVYMIVADLGQRDGAEWDGIKTFKAYRMDAGIPGPRFIHPRWTGLWSAMKRSGAEIYYCSCAGPLPGQR